MEFNVKLLMKFGWACRGAEKVLRFSEDMRCGTGGRLFPAKDG